MSVSITGLEGLRRKLNQDLYDLIKPRLIEEAEDLLSYAEIVSPVKTGLFLSGWEVRTTRDGIQILNPVPYAQYVRRKKSTPLIADLVANEAVKKAPRLKADLSDIISKHLNR